MCAEYMHHTTIKHAFSTNLKGSQRKYCIHLATHGCVRLIERIMKKHFTRYTKVTQVLALTK
jgi:hypothetical protein